MDDTADQHDPPREPAWYRDRWRELMDLLSASTPEEVLDQARTLRNAGFDRPEVALRAIDSMEAQLDELYSEKEATERSDEAGLPQNGDTFDQLQALLAREEKLRRELGVADPGDVIEMVEGLTEQLNDLYAGRDAEQAPDSTVSPPSEAPDETERLLEAELGTSDPEAVVEMMEDLTEQLQVLYENQEQLSAHGIDGIDHALSIIESMEAQLEDVYETREQARDAAASPPDDAPPLSEEMRARLRDMDPDALDALSVGLFRVDDHGRVEWANEQALRWPDVEAETPDALVGTHFFEDVAPAASNALFRGRFAEGVEAGTMDEHFFYTYVGAQSTVTNLTVHLYSPPDRPAHWIGFRILDRR